MLLLGKEAQTGKGWAYDQRHMFDMLLRSERMGPDRKLLGELRVITELDKLKSADGVNRRGWLNFIGDWPSAGRPNRIKFMTGKAVLGSLWMADSFEDANFLRLLNALELARAPLVILEPKYLELLASAEQRVRTGVLRGMIDPSGRDPVILASKEAKSLIRRNGLSGWMGESVMHLFIAVNKRQDTSLLGEEFVKANGHLDDKLRTQKLIHIGNGADPKNVRMPKEVMLNALFPNVSAAARSRRRPDDFNPLLYQKG